MMEMIKHHEGLAVASVIVVFGVLIPCFVARYAPMVREIFLNFMRIFHVPVNTVAEWLRRCLDGGRAWLHTQIAGFSPDGSTDKIVSCIIGSVLYAVFGCFAVFCEIPLATLTLEAMGFSGIAEKLAAFSIMDDGMSIGAIIILTAVVWGFLLADILGVTHFAPVLDRLNVYKWGKLCIGLLCSFGLATSLLVLMAMAYYRGEVTSLSIADLMAPPANAAVQAESAHSQPEPEAAAAQSMDFEALANAESSGQVSSATPLVPEASLPQLSSFAVKMPILIFTATAANMGLLAAVTLAAGSTLLNWIVLAGCSLLLVLVGIVFGVFHVVNMLVSCLANVVHFLLELMIEVGTSLLRLVGIDPMERQAASQARHGAGASSSQSSEPGGANPSNGSTAANEEAEATTGPPPGGFDPFG